MVLPEGFAMPPLPITVGLLGIGSLIALGLYRSGPTIDSVTALVLTPWIALGGGLHVIGVAVPVSETVALLLGTPSVYIATFVLFGATWLGLDAPAVRGRLPVGHQPAVGLIGSAFLAVVSGVILFQPGGFDPVGLGWAVVGLTTSVLLTAALWVLFRARVPDVVSTTGWSGLLVIFAHVLDGVSTLIGIDLLGGTERSTIPALLMDWTGALAISETIGVGWSFLLLKVALAVGIVWYFTPFVREEPTNAHVILILLAAVGLGPGVHNLLLFTVAA